MVSVHNSVTYLTNEVLVPKHDCALGGRDSYLNMSTCELNECVRCLNMTRRSANSKIDTAYCLVHPYR